MRSRLLLLAASAMLALTAAPIHAKAATPAYQLTVTLSFTTMTYGGSTPSLRASLTPPSGDPLVAGNTPYYFTVGGQNYGGTWTSLSAPYGLFLNGLGAGGLDAGQYPVVANYQSPTYGLLTSAPVLLTVQPLTPSLQCTPNQGGSYTFAPDSPFPMTATGVVGGSMRVTFSGPQTSTSPPVPLDGSGGFSVTTPSTPGQYTYRCDYSGSLDYASASVSYPTLITVSANHTVAGITLLTDPAPLRSFTLTTWQVTVAGRPGLPAPTGNVSISIGNAFIRPLIQLGPGGVATFNMTSPAADAYAGIVVGYQGDSVYQPASVHLSINTAPIPNGSSVRANSGTAAATAQGVTGQPSPSPEASPSPVASPSPIERDVSRLINAQGLRIVSDRTPAHFVPIAVGALGLILAIICIAAMAFQRRRRPLPKDATP